MNGKSTEVWSIEKTARSRNGVDILEVSIMVDVAEKHSRTFTGHVYDNHVELLTGSGNLPEDDLKELMAGAAHIWEKSFGDWDSTC